MASDDLIHCIYSSPLIWAESVAHIAREEEYNGTIRGSCCTGWPLFGATADGAWWHMFLGMGAFFLLLPYMALLTLLSPLMLLLGDDMRALGKAAWAAFFFTCYALVSTPIAYACCERTS
jgi:hypothetical protein